MELCHRLDPDCKACGKPVYWKKRIFYLDRLWHLDCFRCARCRVQLNTDADDNDARHSKAYLGEDFALRCDRCNQTFERKKRSKVAFSRPELIDRFEGELVECKRESRKTGRHHCEHHCEHHQLKELSHLNIENEEELRKLVANRHKCHCVGHRCVKDGGDPGERRKCSIDERTKEERRHSKDERKSLKGERRCSMNGETYAKQYADERRFSAEPKRQAGCRRCSMDKRKSIDRKCSVAERKYLKDSELGAAHKKEQPKEQPDRSAGETDSEIYRSLFSNKSVMNKNDRPTSDRPAKCNCRGCTDYMRGLKI